MNRSLLLDLYELTMSELYSVYRKNHWATFDLFVREMPKNRNYLVYCGLEDALGYIKELRFSSDDLDYLAKQKIFSDKFLNYLGRFKFSGDIWAMTEGEVFFPDEPVMRVTAPIIEAQIVESYLLNTINLQTMIASKASRVVLAAGTIGVIDFSLRRTHGPEAGLKAARASYIAGCIAASNVLAGKLYGIPVAGTMAHSLVMSFPEEMDSFLAYANIFPSRTILLVDTYNTRKGIENAVCIGLYLKEKGFRLLGIRLDSGDIVSLSKLARGLLDKAGLKFTKIFASGNLDEFKIKKLLKQGSRIDNFGVGTNMGTSIDAPCLDVVYKLSEVSDESGNFCPVMKLSSGKVTYPGRKQVFRIKDAKGCFAKDILAKDTERITGSPLLKKVVSGGRIIYKFPSLEKIRSYLKDNLARLPDKFKEINSTHRYPVIISPGLRKLRRTLSGHLKRRQ
jgi:nicotinate phosphoribosyltransferase